MSTWGKRLQEIRQKHRLTQADIAVLTGLDNTAISRYERGGGAKQMPTKMKDSLLKTFTLEELNYIDLGEKETVSSQSIKGNNNTQAGRDMNAPAGVVPSNDPIVAAIMSLVSELGPDEKVQVLSYVTNLKVKNNS